MSKMGNHIMDFISTVLCVYSGILSIRHRKAPERFIARIQIIDDTLEKFGVAKNYHALYISHLYRILQMFIVVESVNAINIIALLKNDTSSQIFTLALIIHHLTLMIYISDMVTNTTIKYIGKKFQQLNDILEGYANKELCVTEAERGQARRTDDVIYRLGDTSRDHMIRKEVKDFFLQITQHPVVFSAYGSFDLDYTLIRKMIGTVTTYLVIFIQVDDIRPTDSAISVKSLNTSL
ncbi:uncharacterized protein LOC112493889 [Cephus cinctus]|uniref:Uncharacterized protein LOC112493889 n=1 Tax=Cephus cinctus TaxID=211228 RepID=A0AAJ7RBR6_CEPCN|nr:uncharacterized protein LOC112493889 [Cephus cinctus]